MPDWFYRPIAQRILFRMPTETARNFALGFMGKLARLPLGPAVIDFLGHMRADQRLKQNILGIEFPTAVGLGPGLDTHGKALLALARFGVGFIEVGPVVSQATPLAAQIERRQNEEAIWLSALTGGVCAAKIAPRLAEIAPLRIPVILQIGYAAGASQESAAAEARLTIENLACHVHLFALSTMRHAIESKWSLEEWSEHLRLSIGVARDGLPRRPLLVCVPADAEPPDVDSFVTVAINAGAEGLLVDGVVSANESGYLIGRPTRQAALGMVRHLRERFGAKLPIVALGGIHEPRDALALRSAGADLVGVDSGLVYTGPGLPKRINEALLGAGARSNPLQSADGETFNAPPKTEMTWFWTMLMGAGMLAGSLLALAIASTRVVLPYDESFVGMSRQELHDINSRLLAFMAHDRVTLAGTMVAIGVMYVGLSLQGIRQGLHWAQQSVFISAFTGFASFFLFLGFGYLDPFHAFVTAVLLQLLLLGVHSKLGTPVRGGVASLSNNAAWRWSQWGQLLLIMHGVLLLAAGVAISAVGVTQTFVHEDLEFMNTTPQALESANAKLIPLIAHDRATFGGMLLASGWVFLLPALWGFRAGTTWLWWTFLWAGLSAYAAAIGVHFAVGYMDLWHLVPAFVGLGIFVTGLALSYPYLCRET